MSNEVLLKAKNKADVVLAPKDRTVWMKEPSGVPYVELSNIIVADWYKNSHVKTLTGIYTGGRPTRIKVRDHYPHSIGSAWCRKSNLMTAETNTTRVNVAKTQEFIPVVGENNYTSYKECAFWGSANTLITVGDLQVANSMYYDIIEPYAPEEGTVSYYGDRMSAVGVPMPTTPSPWYYATINYTEQTWESEITLNQFTMFEETAYNQTYLYWKPYHVTNYPKGLNYDPRLHAIEIDITSSYEGETIHGKRIYYIWHVPQHWALIKAPKIEITTGSYSRPSGLHHCDAFTSGYDTGYTASGGTGKIELQGNDITYENILYELYPSIPKETSETLNNPNSIAIDGDGNSYIVSSFPTWANNEVKKYDSEQNYISKFSTPQAVEILCIDDYLYVSQWCIVKKYDLDGTLILSIGSSGTGDGQFSSDTPMIEYYNGHIYALTIYKIQKFDTDGNYISKINRPTGINFTDLCFDDNGNLYVIAKDSSNYQRLLLYDPDFNLLDNINFGRVAFDNITYYDEYLYIDGNYLVDPEEYTYISGVLKIDTNGNYIETHEVDIIGIVFIDPAGNFYISPTDQNKISVYNSSWVWQFDIGTKINTTYVERNTNNFGIFDIAQVDKAYAVVSPNNFDPTNPSTYSEMTEYTGADFSEITLTADGLLRFKNLYPTNTTHYIYILAKYNPAGTKDVQHSWCSSSTGTYCPEETVGNKRAYRWFTRYPSCSEYYEGSITENCNQFYTFEEWMTDGRTIEVFLDDFDSGIDINTVTFLYEWFYWMRVYSYGKGSDGGRTNFWLGYGANGVKKDYNSMNDATNIPAMGLPVLINYSNQDTFLYDGVTENYGWDIGAVKLINRTLKDGSYLTTGFDANHNIERIAV